MEVYETVKLIGSGAFGQVYLVKNKREDKLYVNKKIKTRDMSQKDRENTENEVRLLQKLRHANIVAYKDSYMDREQFLNIVMIHCEGGDMHNKIKSQKGKNFTEEQILDWLAQMALALFYLHEKKILHRDLKTQNIFLKHGRVRLGDFGIAKVLDSTRDFANTCIGTPYYMSPELFKYKPYSYKSDVWAFGCVLYEMCNLRHAFDAQDLSGLAVKIMNGSYPPINSTYTKALRGLIGKMLQLNPKNRPSILDIINVSIVKRRIVAYVTDILNGNYPEANLANDVDDVYLDSLKEQAQKLGILKIINSNISNKPQVAIIQQSEDQPRPPKRVGSRKQNNEKSVQEAQEKEKKELLKQISEKNRIEEEIKRLEKKKISRSSSTIVKGSQSSSQQAPEGRVNPNKGGGEQERRGERSYSFERESSVNRKKPNQQGSASQPSQKSSVNSIRNEVRKARQQSDSLSQQKKQFNDFHQNFRTAANSESEVSVVGSKGKYQQSRQSYDNQQVDDIPVKKEYLKHEQEKRKKHEQEELEQKRKQIQQENQLNRQKATQMKAAQYRHSKDNTWAQGDEEGQQQSSNQQSTINKRGSMQSLEQKKQNEEVSLDLIERESFDQKNSSLDYNSNNNNSSVYNSEKYAPPISAIQNIQEDKIPSPKAGKGQIKIQEEMGMDEEQDYEEDEEEGVIKEEDNEESEEEQEEEDPFIIDEKIELMKTKLKEKTVKINTLKEALSQSKKATTLQRNQQEIIENEEEEEDNAYYEQDEEGENGNDSPALDDDDDYNEREGEVDIDQLAINNPQYFKIQDRIKLCRHRCEASLGQVILDKAYDYLKENTNKSSNEEIRKQLSSILSEENIGFWHLIDQMLFLENLSKQIPKQIPKQNEILVNK